MPAHRYAVVAAALATDPRQAVIAARQGGFDGLLFDAFGVGLNIADLSGTGRREFRHVLSAQDRQLVGLRVDVGIKGFGPGADVDRLLSQFDKVLDAAADLGAPLVVAEIGPLPEPPPDAPPKPAITSDQAGLILLPSLAPQPTPAAPAQPLDAVFAAAVDSGLAELGARADRRSVIVALRSELSSLAALDRVLTSVRCPWFGVDLDPASVLRDSWDLDETFSRLGPQVRHVRGRDAVRGADRRTKPAVIGRGDTAWDHLLSNLDGTDYHGWLTFDPTDLPDRPAAAVSGLKYLRLHESQ
jgi:sugar phosphate isomerase/epimerase